jgi:large repetitive protein
MHKSLAAALFLLAFSATAGTITSIEPSTIQAWSGEHFITVRGQQLGNQLLYDGPAGTYEVEASSATGDSVVGWVPQDVVNSPGAYSVRVGGSDGVSNAARLDIVEPPHPLVVLGQDPIVVQAENSRGAHVTFEVHAYGGRDPNPVVRCDPPSGSLFPLGPSYVRCTADNRYGEHAEGGVYIYVQDGSAPVLTLPDDIVVEAESEEGTVVTFEATAHDDVDGELQVTCSPSSGSRFPIGVTTVECSATDSSLNPIQSTFTVEVRSTEEPPVLFIQVPDPIVVEANGPAGTVVAFTVTTHGSTDPEPSVSCDPASESTFPLGTTTVTCTASDRFGQRAEGTFTVTVADTTPPALDGLHDRVVQATGPGGAVVTFEVTASDVVDRDVTVECSPASGSQFPNGNTTVRCSAEDDHGNTASGSFTVTVTEDGGVLVMQLPDPIEVEADGPEGAVVEFVVTTHGSTDPEPTVTCDPPSGSTFPIGTTHVDCVATDNFGRRAEGTFTVTVTEPEEPTVLVLEVPDSFTVEATGPDGAVVEYTVSTEGSTDPEPTVTCDPASGSTFPVGTTQVDCTATDSFGGHAEGTFTVTVTDAEEPSVLVLEVPDSFTVEATGPDGAVVEYSVSTEGSTDPEPTVTCDPASGSTFPIGTTHVDCTATDSFGGHAEGTFAVTVRDSVDPMIASLSATPNVLEPPNHKLIDVTVTAEAVDAVDPMPQCRIFDVTANEPILGSGSGSTDFDWRITGDLELELRAERSGEGTDRIYRVHVVCSDASGNSASGAVEVTVPKSASSGGSATVEPAPTRRRSVGKGR